jgi:hypothetical protein
MHERAGEGRRWLWRYRDAVVADHPVVVARCGNVKPVSSITDDANSKMVNSLGLPGLIGPFTSCGDETETPCRATGRCYRPNAAGDLMGR